MDDVFKQGIKELVICRPNQVIENLKSSDLSINNMSVKMDILMEGMQEIKEYLKMDRIESNKNSKFNVTENFAIWESQIEHRDII